MSDYSVLIEQLADIGDERLDQLVKDARKLRTSTKKDKIPQAVKDSLVRKLDRLEEGQTTSIIVKPEIQFTFTVKAHKDWEETECSIVLLNDDDMRSAALFKLYDLPNQEWFESHKLRTLEPHLNEMVDDERRAHQSWMDDYYHLSSEYGVNAYELVEQLKKDETP